MNKRIREKIDSWDLKSVFLTVIFFAIGIFLFFYFSGIRDRYRQQDKEEFKGQTTGQIISIEPVKQLNQSRWKGTRILTDRYNISYRYTVGGKNYQKTDVVPVSLTNEKLIIDILDRGPDDTFPVKFDETDPNRSLLIERE